MLESLGSLIWDGIMDRAWLRRGFFLVVLLLMFYFGGPSWHGLGLWAGIFAFAEISRWLFSGWRGKG